MSQAYLNSIKEGAIKGWVVYKVLPSITASQAILESGWGSSKLAKPPYNNNFGIKSSPDWTGRTVTMPTREWVNGRYITVNASFRAYNSLSDSIADHAAFFTNTPWRTNNYKNVVGETDYKKAARALQSAGYATDPQYAAALIRVIEENNLQRWDQEGFNGLGKAQDTPTSSNQGNNTTAFQAKSKRVGGKMTTEAVRKLESSTLTIIGDQHASALIDGVKPKAKGLNSKIVNGISEVPTALASFTNLGDIVIVLVGTNGGATQGQINAIIQAIGDTKLLLVDTGAEVEHAYQVASLYQANAMNNQNVFWCDWYQYSRPMDGQYYNKDTNGKKTILSSEGKGQLVIYVIQGIYEALTGDFSNRSAEASKENLLTVKTVKLDVDGMMYFPAYDINGNKIEGKKQTKYRGLYSPYGDPFIYNSVAQQIHGIPTRDGHSIWIDAEFKDTSIEAGYQLMEKGCEVLLSKAEPAVQYTVDLADLPKNVSIGDTGVFIDHYYDPPLYIQARILSITTSRTDPRLNKAVIGNVVELHPKPKPEIKAIQNQIKQNREQMLVELIDNKPTNITLERTNGDIISETSSTSLIATVYQENINITDRFVFKWERTSSDPVADNEFNQQLADSWQSSVLLVRYEDIIGKENKFEVTIFDTKGNVINSSDTVVKKAQSGKNAYELAVDKGFSGTLEEWLASLDGKDGNDGIPGSPGTDGKTSYLHIAYANSPNGLDFTTTKLDGKEYTYLGQYSDFNKSDSQNYAHYSWVYIKGPSGRDGLPGKDGLGFKSTIITYGISPNETTQPSNWSSNVPLLVKGQYLWTKTEWTYTDNTIEVGFTKTYIAKDGNSGNDGLPGKDGTGIKQTIIHYAQSASGIDVPSNGWSTTVPLVPNGRFLWTRTTWSYTDGTSETGYSVAKMGDTGPKGTDGKDAHLFFAYANKDASGNFIDFSTSDENRDWKGYYSSNDPVQKTDPSLYTWEQSPHLIKKEVDKKPSSDDLNKVIGEQTTLSVALQGKMDIVAYQDQQKKYDQFLQTVQTDSRNAAEIAKQAEAASVKVSNDLQAQAERWGTLDGYIQIDGQTNSLSISNKTANTQVILDDEGLKFVDGGVVVGIISKQYLEIMRGIFAKSVQVGRHKIEPLASDQRHLLITYLGGGN